MDDEDRIEREREAFERAKAQLNQEKERLRSLKNITIRGINPDLYDEFTQRVKTLNLSIGDAVNRMMTDIIEDFNGTFPQLSARGTFGKLALEKAYIAHHDKLSISKRDLEEANTVFYFQHIDQLIIEPDVDLETFQTYIHSIQHCGLVKIPNILPKLLLLSKIRFCEKIEVYKSNLSNQSPKNSNNED